MNSMKHLKVIETKDGSKSIFLQDMNETYHSKFGAKIESEHVYINAGFFQIKQPKINILEIGFGTGLNVILTLKANESGQKRVYFETLEKYPLPQDVINQIEFYDDKSLNAYFKKVHNAAWDQPVIINKQFSFCKKHTDLLIYQSDIKFDLVYFDAFAPDKQPEMWRKAIFEKMYNLLKENGLLVTYSAKGSVRRTMQSVGFMVERIPGPPGKREMLRAIKKP
jgi:tRNA U34 5-methylaminomethyl-2-thiouridine-forming methyltransferase MnmC